MSMRRIISLAAVATLGIAFVSADAFAARVAARGGAVAARTGAVGVRGGALANRGRVYGGPNYRPGLGLAAGAVVGGAIAASQPWYGNGGYGYGSGYGYGYDPGYGAAAYAPAGSYDNYGYIRGSGFNPDTHDTSGFNPGYSYGSDPSTSYAYDPGSAGGCISNGGNIMCNGQCWLNDNGTHFRWGDCPAAIRVKTH